MARHASTENGVRYTGYRPLGDRIAPAGASPKCQQRKDCKNYGGFLNHSLILLSTGAIARSILVMNWSPWQLKFGSHICKDLVRNSSSMAANWLEDSFGVQQVPAFFCNSRRNRFAACCKAFKISGYGFLRVFDGLLPSAALRDASRQGRNLRDENPIFVLFDQNTIFHFPPRRSRVNACEPAHHRYWVTSALGSPFSTLILSGHVSTLNDSIPSLEASLFQIPDGPSVLRQLLHRRIQDAYLSSRLLVRLL